MESSSSKGISLDEFIFRKLQPVRILVNYLNHEMALNDSDQLTLSRNDFDNVISTLEIYLEEYDKVSNFESQRGKTRNKFTSERGAVGSIKAIA